MDTIEDYHKAINEPNIRVVDIGTPNPLKLERRDPYGFWWISATKGPTPDALTGSFTTVDEARREITRYLEKSGRQIKTIK